MLSLMITFLWVLELQFRILQLMIFTITSVVTKGNDSLATKSFEKIENGEWQTGDWKAGTLKATNIAEHNVVQFSTKQLVLTAKNISRLVN